MGEKRLVHRTEEQQKVEYTNRTLGLSVRQWMFVDHVADSEHISYDDAIDKLLKLGYKHYKKMKGEDFGGQDR